MCTLELTYRRWQEYFDPDGNVWHAHTSDLYETYGPVSGTGSAQQLKQKNDDAWKLFFEALDTYHNGDCKENRRRQGTGAPAVTATVDRDGDVLTCLDCTLLVHADIAGAGNMLANETDVATSEFFRPSHRPTGPPPGRDGRVTLTHLEWNDHEWTPQSGGTFGSFDQRRSADLASSTLAPTGCGDYGGIPRR